MGSLQARRDAALRVWILGLAAALQKQLNKKLRIQEAQPVLAGCVRK
ncbi:MAG: hypothetical protein IV104_07755 [Acidovorax sp.]|nr:hypothetical protein [Acidovorax sp.]